MMAEAYFGTSGFDYVEWKPSFYPPDLKRKEFLRYYATRFRSVELNNTFYRMPDAQRIKSWVREGRDVFAYIKHEDNPEAPLIALDFAK